MTQTELQAPWKLKRFIQEQVIPDLNLQRNDRSTDQFAAVILSENNLNQIDNLWLSKGITILCIIYIIICSLSVRWSTKIITHP